MRSFLFWTAAVLIAMTFDAVARGQERDADGIAFFESKIRPVLVGHCYSCHSAEAEKAKKLKGGLRLDTRAGVRMGGESGPALIAGMPGKSLILDALRHGELKMPPKGKLPESVIAHFAKWIEMGAPDPRTGDAPVKAEVDWAKAKEHWAFQPVRRPNPPAVKDASWPRSDIDRFLLAGLEQRDLRPAADAPRDVLIRRLYDALIGLPPTFAEVEAFVNDPAPDAVPKLVDRLLASPQFGVRWARLWLDNARYTVIIRSDGEGRIAIPSEPYRDWVVRAFNGDMPYRDFIRYQVAGDLLAESDVDRAFGDPRTATGVWGLAPYAQNVDPLAAVADHVDEQLDFLGRTMMGVTLACARCHDHKFDPILQDDYYGLAGMFFSSHAYSKPVVGQHVAEPMFASQADESRWREIDADYASLKKRHDASKKKHAKAQPLLKLRDDIAKLEAKLAADEVKDRGKAVADLAAKRQESRRFADELRAAGDADLAAFVGLDDSYRQRKAEWDAFPRQLILREGGIVDRWKDKSRPAPVFVRGDPHKPARDVDRGFPTVLAAPGEKSVEGKTTGSGRLELARWLVREDHPLTARVMVNRVWNQLFGRGIVGTPSDFGHMGDPPTHPELLDRLTSDFVANGWSVKSLIRSIVLSRAYGMSSTPADAAASRARDADNRFLSRSPRRRLNAESLIDRLSLLAGSLRLEFDASPGRSTMEMDRDLRRSGRALYRPPSQREGDSLLDPFDGANPNVLTPRRDESTTAPQALFLLNNPLARKAAEAVAAGLKGESVDERIRQAYASVLQRRPTDDESRLAMTLLASFAAERAKESPARGVDVRAWADFCQVLICSNEFLYVE